jgi:hypothetical protein
MAALDLTKREEKGSPITMEEHDTNLTNIETEVNALQDLVGTDDEVGDLFTRVATVESDIGDLESNVSTNTSDIGDNVTAIGLNTTHRTTTSGNPHSVSKSDVGLGNVTNHEQLKKDTQWNTDITAKATPDDADLILSEDSEALYVKKKSTWTQIKAFLKTYFDTLYSTITHASQHTDGTDDIQSATSEQKGLATATQITKLDGIETLADVTDAANVDAAGAVMEADFNAKGDILVATADNTPAVLSVGADGLILTADATEDAGMKWSSIGTVTSSSNITDNCLVRGDGGVKGIQKCSTITVSDDGEMVNTAQPFFEAYVSAGLKDVTGDGTSYSISGTFWTEDFDIGNNFSNGIFTAPVDGIYLFSAKIKLDDIKSSHTNGHLWIYSTNGQREIIINPYNAAGGGTQIVLSLSLVTKLDANDTANLGIAIYSGDKVIDIVINNTVFSGVLIN